MINKKTVYIFDGVQYDAYENAKRAETAAKENSINEDFMSLIADFIGDDRFDGVARDSLLSQIRARFNITRRTVK